VVELLAVDLVRRADADLGQLVEDVELGQVEGGVAVDQRRVLDDDEVEPAAPSSAARGRAVFGADLLQMLAGVLCKVSVGQDSLS
jgi:hypothetical protein